MRLCLELIGLAQFLLKSIPPNDLAAVEPLWHNLYILHILREVWEFRSDSNWQVSNRNSKKRERSRAMAADANDVIEAKVLIVDDNEQNVELLNAYMEEIEGVDTVTAKNGAQALTAVSRERPDLVLLDIMMPVMSGYEVCKQLKNDATTRDIPVIMITALNEPSDFERAMECGADDFLTRPFNRTEFLTRIRSMLRIKKLRGDLGKRP